MFGKRPFRVINNGINCENFAFNEKVRAEYRKLLDVEDKTVIGHIGRFERQKNHTFLIDLFKKYAETHPDAVLLLVGEGHLFDDIRKKVDDLGLNDKVQFLGVRSDLEGIYQALDLFILPSLFEGLPVVGVEAQSAGLPILTADTVTSELCVTEFVEMLPLEASYEIWCDKIDDMLKNITRRNTLEDMNKAGFNIRNTADFLQDYYIKHSI